MTSKEIEIRILRDNYYSELGFSFLLLSISALCFIQNMSYYFIFAMIFFVFFILMFPKQSVYYENLRKLKD